jgi:hypothetical protein
MESIQVRFHTGGSLKGLSGVPITKVGHADNIMTACSCPSGFQIHLNGSQSWVDNNGSVPKCDYQRPRQLLQGSCDNWTETLSFIATIFQM